MLIVQRYYRYFAFHFDILNIHDYANNDDAIMKEEIDGSDKKNELYRFVCVSKNIYASDITETSPYKSYPRLAPNI